MIWTIEDVLSQRVRLFAVSRRYQQIHALNCFSPGTFPCMENREQSTTTEMFVGLEPFAKLATSTAELHETAGQAERMNRIIGQYLRICVQTTRLLGKLSCPLRNLPRTSNLVWGM
jgi:hypothetical protein